jgi:hypothetical protein
MATTVNLLSADSALLRATSASVSIPISSSGTEWVSTNSTLSVIPTEFVTSLRYVLRVAPSGAGDVTLILDEQLLRLAENGKTLSFNAKLRPSSESIVTSQLVVDGETAPAPHQQTLSGGLYGAIQSNTVLVPDDGVSHTVSASITISGHGGGNIFLTYPNLIDDRAYYNNQYIALARNFMPDFYWEIDSQEQYPTAPFHRLLDILTSASNEVMTEYRDIYPFERYEITNAVDSAERIANSVLVSPQFVRDKYVNWLSQFTGSAIRKNISKSDGNPFFTTYENIRAFIEWQLTKSLYGRGAGTRGALIDSARQVLLYTKDDTESTRSVSITPNYNGDSWSFLVRTLENETPDASNGESSHLVLAAMEPARPMGYKIFHETIDDFYLTLDDIAFGRLSEIRLGEVVAPTDALDSITVSSVTSNSVTLTFLPLSVPGGGDGGGIISNYQYALSTNGTTYGSYTALSPAKGSPPITITGLSSSQNYWVKLKAVNEAGVSAVESTAVTFTTSA